MVPAQIPGGPELLILAVVFLVLLAIPVALIGVVVYFVRSKSGGSDPERRRIAELEERVETLEGDRDRESGPR
ncbi:hypothetical protein [Haloparvum sedimenti]|uniref:hypothetical protein n=1 Tax=Haloparvum sedimenti TaxID=1678448 RepID=UPI00071E980C|nr:hypothetical protein [Haloparvum sedimenti]